MERKECGVPGGVLWIGGRRGDAPEQRALRSQRRAGVPLHRPCVVMAAGFLTASYAREPWLVVAALAASFVAFMSMLGPANAVPMQFLAGRAAAAALRP